jgi:hypothetical protein
MYCEKTDVPTYKSDVHVGKGDAFVSHRSVVVIMFVLVRTFVFQLHKREGTYIYLALQTQIPAFGINQFLLLKLFVADKIVRRFQSCLKPLPSEIFVSVERYAPTLRRRLLTGSRKNGKSAIEVKIGDGKC